MNAAAKELPVSYDLSKPQEDKEPYVGSVLFFKHVIFTVTLLLILIPTTLSIYLSAQVRSLNRQLDAAGSQLAAMQEQLPSTAPEGGEPMRDAYSRIWNAVKEIAAANEGKTVACTTHGGVMRCLLCRLLLGDISHLAEMGWSDNTAVTLLRFSGEEMPEVVFYNDASHLPPELL